MSEAGEQANPPMERKMEMEVEAQAGQGTFRVRLEPGGHDIAAPAASTVLQAALHAGVPMPNSCRNGTCRTCLCRLASGRVGYRIAWPGLSVDEKEDGYFLPCVAYPQSDLIVDMPAI